MAPAPPARRAAILTVDDDMLIATSTMTNELGHQVVEASSARDALEILRDDPVIDLTITDDTMPS